MNKYQEALDELSFPLYDSSCGGCKCGTSDCHECEKAQAVFTLEQLINEHFDNQFLDAEVELLISLLRRVEDELGMDITLLIDKLKRIQSTLPKEKGVVESVEYD